jgi:hypothetical protein
MSPSDFLGSGKKAVAIIKKNGGAGCVEKRGEDHAYRSICMAFAQIDGSGLRRRKARMLHAKLVQVKDWNMALSFSN